MTDTVAARLEPAQDIVREDEPSFNVATIARGKPSNTMLGLEPACDCLPQVQADSANHTRHVCC